MPSGTHSENYPRFHHPHLLSPSALLGYHFFHHLYHLLLFHLYFRKCHKQLEIGHRNHPSLTYYLSSLLNRHSSTVYSFSSCYPSLPFIFPRTNPSSRFFLKSHYSQLCGHQFQLPYFHKTVSVIGPRLFPLLSSATVSRIY